MIFRVLIFLSLVFFSTFSYALIEGINPYAGIDGGRRYMPFKSGFGKNLFEKSVPQWTPYLGLQINDFLSVEGGYQSTGKKTKARNTVPGDQGLGFDFLEGDFAEGQLYREVLKGWHLNVLAFSPICVSEIFPSVQFFGGVGLSRKRVSLQTETISTNGTPNTQEGIDLSRRSFKKKKSFLRLSFGVQKLLTDNFGVRAIIDWENTARFGYLNSLEVPEGITIANLKNTCSFGLGFFVKF